MAKKISLDSNIFIYHFERNPAYITYTDKILNLLSRNKAQAATSVVSIIETLSYPSPPKVTKDITEAFLKIPNLKIYDVTLLIAFESARIRREYDFRMPDAIQLATALSAKTSVFITNDKRLKKFKELKVILINERF